MKLAILSIAGVLGLTLLAERQPFERYQSILDRQMFGRPPDGFDPTKPASAVTKTEQRELSREQEVLKSSIHFSAINVTPDGATAVGFTDNSDQKAPVHYYLKVGEARNGWKVLEADPVKATMKIAKDDIEVSLELGANSAKGGGSTARAGVPGAAGAVPGVAGAGVPRAGGGFFGRRAADGGGAAGAATPGLLGSLRSRRFAREQERQKEAAANAERAAAENARREEERRRNEEERAQRAAEREEQRAQLQQIQEELRKAREARAARAAEQQPGADGVVE